MTVNPNIEISNFFKWYQEEKEWRKNKKAHEYMPMPLAVREWLSYHEHSKYIRLFSLLVIAISFFVLIAIPLLSLTGLITTSFKVFILFSFILLASVVILKETDSKIRIEEKTINPFDKQEDIQITYEGEMDEIFYYLLPISITLIGYGLISQLITVVYQLGFPLTHNLVILLNLLVFLGIQISFFIFIFMKKEEYKEFTESDLLKTVFKKPYLEEDGDVYLCMQMEEKMPVILRNTDRYLHTLVLGPTGSGKTALVLTNMVNQDLQVEGRGITVIEPKGDFAEEIEAMAEYHGRLDDIIYFNPIMRNCPYFNPLYGDTATVTENFVTTFVSLSSDSSGYFQGVIEVFIRNAIPFLKYYKGNEATVIDLYHVALNSNGIGKDYLDDFKRKIPTFAPDKQADCYDIVSWFETEYYNENSKTFEHTTKVRIDLKRLISNPYLKLIFDSPNGRSDVDFEKHLAEGTIYAITTAQGKLGDILSRYLGYFIILQFQSAVFSRPGNSDTRRPHSLYIDEFQVYANSSFENMLTQGRSYRVAVTIATQNRALIGQNAGTKSKSFIEMVSTNARNIILFGGANVEDATYYSQQFGEIERIRKEVGVTKQKFDIMKGLKPLNYDTESHREVVEEKPIMTTADIIYLDEFYIAVRMVENMKVLPPVIGKASYIDGDIYSLMQKRVNENHERLEAYEKELQEAEARAYGFKPSEEEEDKGEQDTTFEDAVIFNFEDESVVVEDEGKPSKEKEEDLHDMFAEMSYNEEDDMDLFEEMEEVDFSSSEMEEVDDFDVIDEGMNQSILNNMDDDNSFL